MLELPLKGQAIISFSLAPEVGRHGPDSRSNDSNKIPLPQFNTAMPQNVVSGGAMEIEVGHHEMQ
jgi:hypothetical protein